MSKPVLGNIAHGGTKYVIPHAPPVSSGSGSGSSEYTFPPGLQGQVWTWQAGVPQWETPSATPGTVAATYGYIFAPSVPAVGTNPVTVFTLAFPTSGTTVVHLTIQGVVIDLTDDPSVQLPCEMQGRFRVIDRGYPTLAIVQETGLIVLDNTVWQFNSVYNVDHNEISLVLSPSSSLWQSSSGFTSTSFGASSQWTFNFEVIVRTEYSSSASAPQYAPTLTSTNGMYRLNQVFTF
jgi:hypothetical protein